jgi:hypothetical protein
VLPEFFKNFWVRRMALDRRNYKQLVETTVEIANKVKATAPHTPHHNPNPEVEIAEKVL